jgi:hypothetical protein
VWLSNRSRRHGVYGCVGTGALYRQETGSTRRVRDSMRIARPFINMTGAISIMGKHASALMMCHCIGFSSHLIPSTELCRTDPGAVVVSTARKEYSWTNSAPDRLLRNIAPSKRIQISGERFHLPLSTGLVCHFHLQNVLFRSSHACGKCRQLCVDLQYRHRF